jgi:nucleotide-binding universal stress UspA family protein
MKEIVVGLDEGADTRHLVDWAAQFAHDMGARITFVHGVPRAELWAVAGVMLDSAKHVTDLRHRLERTFVTPLRDRAMAVDLRVEIGDPAHKLIEHATRLHAELIIVGGAPHGGIRDLVGGHLAQRLEHLSRVPILVVPRIRDGEPLGA